jgi:ribosome-associated protein
LASKKTSKGDDRPKLKSSHAAAPGASRFEERRSKRPPTQGRTAKRSAAFEGGTAQPKLPRPPRALKKTRAPALSSQAQGSDKARNLAIEVAVAALEKKAVGLQVLDVAGKVDYADFLVIMTGRSDRQVQALASGIEDALRKKGTRAIAVEGLPHATWVLMDYGDVVVHVFQDEARSVYDIEGLWMDAARLPIPGASESTD